MLISDWSSDVCSSDLTASCAQNAEARAQRHGREFALYRRSGTPRRFGISCAGACQFQRSAQNRKPLILPKKGVVLDQSVLQPRSGRHRCQRSEEHTSELQSLMRIPYAVFCLKKNNTNTEVN